MVLATVVDDKLGNNTSAHIVTTTKRLIVHLRRLERHRQVVLVQRGSRWVKESIDVSNRLVRAVSLL